MQDEPHWCALLPLGKPCRATQSPVRSRIAPRHGYQQRPPPEASPTGPFVPRHGDLASGDHGFSELVTGGTAPPREPRSPLPGLVLLVAGVEDRNRVTVRYPDYLSKESSRLSYPKPERQERSQPNGDYCRNEIDHGGRGSQKLNCPPFKGPTRLRCRNPSKL